MTPISTNEARLLDKRERRRRRKGRRRDRERGEGTKVSKQERADKPGLNLLRWAVAFTYYLTEAVVSQHSV